MIENSHEVDNLILANIVGVNEISEPVKNLNLFQSALIIVND